MPEHAISGVTTADGRPCTFMFLLGMNETAEYHITFPEAKQKIGGLVSEWN